MRKLFLTLSLIPVLLFTMAFKGCTQHQIVAVEHNFKIGVDAASKIELNEFNAGNVSREFHIEFNTTILKVAQVGEQVSVDLAAGAPNATVVSELSTIASSLQTLIDDGAVGIKNPTTRANVDTSVQAAIDLVKNLETGLGGKI